MSHGQPAASSRRNPLVIGGAPGSGTRAYKAVVEAAGVRMLDSPALLQIVRPHRPVHHDNLFLRRFFYQRALRSLSSKPTRASSRWALELRFWLELSGPLKKRQGDWGWKNPMTMHLLPLIASTFHEASFILVVRDGRDMALGSKHALLERTQLLSAEDLQKTEAEQAATYWLRSNQRALSEGSQLFGERFLVSRWEDLTTDPVAEIERIHRFLGVDDEGLRDAAAAQVASQGSAGRWRDRDRAEIDAVQAICGDLLETFGYELSTER